MILSTYQPYFAPFPGFFYKIYHSDVMVILDDVQFPQGTTWINRNRFKNDQGILWMTIPVWKKGLGLQKINKVQICNEGRWAKKHLESLKIAYEKSPFFEDHADFIEDLFRLQFEKLIDLNMKIIRYLVKFFGIDTKIILQSELDIEPHAKGNQLLIDIGKKLGAKYFLSQRSAQNYLTVNLFQDAGIRLNFMKIKASVYPQLWGSFIPNLSVFDLVFNCGPKSLVILRTK